MSYARRYPGGFVDYPDESTPADSQFFNAVENALIAGGSGGGGDLNYVFTQSTPSASWSIFHGLGKFPAVSVVDSGGSEIVPDVLYVDTNNVTLSFASATSGKAYMN